MNIAIPVPIVSSAPEAVPEPVNPNLFSPEKPPETVAEVVASSPPSHLQPGRRDSWTLTSAVNAHVVSSRLSGARPASMGLVNKMCVVCEKHVRLEDRVLGPDGYAHRTCL